MGCVGGQIGALELFDSPDDCSRVACGVMAKRKNNQTGIIILKNAASVMLNITPVREYANATDGDTAEPAAAPGHPERSARCVKRLQTTPGAFRTSSKSVVHQCPR